MSNNKHIIAVVGPTAIGKTTLAIKLAKYFSTEIISADSRQFYQEMSIGTAVPTADELAEVKHHFIQHKSIHDHYSVGDFEKEAIEMISHLFEKLDVLILVGGSGLYVDAIINGLNDFPDIGKEIRENLNARLMEKGIECLQQDLKIRDVDYFERVDLNNPHRLVRALEICIGTGKPYSYFLQQKKVKRPFNSLYLGITADRSLIYDRINKRVELMVEKGLVEEAMQLLPYRNRNALNTVGYKELFSHFDGHFNLPTAITEIKKNTRRFAKRQLTWYRKNDAITWCAHNDRLDKVIGLLTQKMAGGR